MTAIHVSMEKLPVPWIIQKLHINESTHTTNESERKT